MPKKKSSEVNKNVFLNFRTAGWVEIMAGRIGVKTPDLSPEQAKAKAVSWMIGLVRLNN